MDLSNPGTMNRYAYVGGDPINSADPQGLDYVYVNGMLTASFESCMPDLAEPGLFNTGLGNMPCSDGTMISTFATPAEIANCQAPILGPEGTGPAPYEPPLQVPACFAQLKDRPVNDPKASLCNAYHSFWWIQDSTGAQDIISAGPLNGFLDVWVVPGANNGADNSGDTTVWNSGLLSSVCDQVSALEAAANSFPKDKIRYSAWPGPNSNSAAHYLANAGDFYFSVPFNLYGWDVGFPVPGMPGPGKGRIRHCPGGRPVLSRRGRVDIR